MPIRAGVPEAVSSQIQTNVSGQASEVSRKSSQFSVTLIVEIGTQLCVNHPPLTADR
jgi:hypothetical protein